MKYLSEAVIHIAKAIERTFRYDAIGAVILACVLCCGGSSLIKSCGIAMGYIIHGPAAKTIEIEPEPEPEPDNGLDIGACIDTATEQP